MIEKEDKNSNFIGFVQAYIHNEILLWWNCGRRMIEENKSLILLSSNVEVYIYPLIHLWEMRIQDYIRQKLRIPQLSR